MTPPGRPKGEYRKSQPEGTRLSAVDWLPVRPSTAGQVLRLVLCVALQAASAAQAAGTAPAPTAVASPTATAAAAPAAALSAEPIFTWRLDGWQALPGAAVAPAAGGERWPHRSLLTLRGTDLQGPPPLACGRARVALLKIPPEGLFQGGLPAPVADARRLGLAEGPVLTMRIDCDNASLDLHHHPSGRWLLALDGRIARWRELGIGTAPGAAVLALLQRHLLGREHSLAGQVRAVRPWLHPRLRQRFAAYLRHPWPRDEVPPLDGDPFTDSQEPPDRLELLDSRIDGHRAEQTVRVVFGPDGERQAQRLLRYELERHHGRWRLIDIRDERGDTLGGVLDRR